MNEPSDPLGLETHNGASKNIDPTEISTDKPEYNKGYEDIKHGSRTDLGEQQSHILTRHPELNEGERRSRTASGNFNTHAAEAETRPN